MNMTDMETETLRTAVGQWERMATIATSSRSREELERMIRRGSEILRDRDRQDVIRFKA